MLVANTDYYYKSLSTITINY